MEYCILTGLIALLQVNSFAPQNSYDQIFESAKQLQVEGHFQEAEMEFRSALEVGRSNGAESEQVANALNQLASLCNQLGRYNEAEQLFRRSLGMWVKLRGRQDPNVAAAMNNLANVHRGQGRLDEAEPLIRKAMLIQEDFYGTQHPEVAVVLNNLALLRQERGKLGEAEALLQRVIGIFEEALGPEHPRTIQTLENLATITVERGRSVQAEQLQRRLLAVRERTLGPNHPLIASSLERLALTCEQLHRPHESEVLYRRALAILDSAGTATVNLASILNNLATLLARTPQYREAEPLSARAVLTAEELMGSDHPMVTQLLANHAAILRKLRRDAEAKTLEQRSRTIQSQSRGRRTVGFTVDVRELAADRTH